MSCPECDLTHPAANCETMLEVSESGVRAFQRANNLYGLRARTPIATILRNWLQGRGPNDGGATDESDLGRYFKSLGYERWVEYDASLVG